MREYLPEAPDRDLYSLAQRLLLKSGQPIPKMVNPEPVSYQEGRRDVFWVTDLADMKMYQVEAVLLRVSEHAYWYFERGSEPPEEALERAIQALEESIYPVVTGAFGQEWTPGVDNDPHITILHSRLRGAAGYYSASDEYPREVYPYSNEREMVYMNTANLPVGSSAYLGTLAHELQHAVHWARDPGEETWVNEGLSEVAKGLAGYNFSFIGDFVSSPATPLTTWPSDGQSTFPYYGAATLFMEYLAQRYGGHDNLWRLVERPEDGVEGVTAYLRSMGYQETFEDVFQEWLVANYLDSRKTNGYYYDGLDVKVKATEVMTGYGERRGTLPQYAGEYVEVTLKEGSTLVAFQGQVATPLLPTTPHSGSHCWWGNRGDSIDSTLTAELDLSQVSAATLGFWAWYAIEESWDYAYVEVSTDGGETWDILEGKHASPENPVGVSFGPGYTGESGGWLEESVDLTPYAGRRILLRFEYVTDEAVNGDGICIDDLSVREIGFFDDAESQGVWDAQGFVRTDNQVPQGYLVQVIEIGNGVVVRDMSLDKDGRGSLVVEGFGAGLERAVVVIAPVAPRTTQPAPYVLSVGPVPKPGDGCAGARGQGVPQRDALEYNVPMQSHEQERPPNTHRPPTPGKPPQTPWDQVASWYDSHVGGEGSEYHQRVIIPGTLRLLEMQPGERVLDLACGQGVLCRALQPLGVQVTGVDLSGELIRRARQRSSRGIRYLVADARGLAGILPGESFHAVACVLSVQNMDPVEPVFAQCARLLEPGGRLVLVMTHPAFRIPRQTRWGWDEERKLLFRAVDRYLSSVKVPIDTQPFRDPGQMTWTYHRPLQTYVNGLASAGLWVNALEEWPSPKVSQPGPKARAENRARAEFPLFLALRAIRVSPLPLPKDGQ